MSTTTTDNIQTGVTTTTANDEEHKFIPISSHDLDDDVKSNHKQRYIMLLVIIYIYIV